MSANNQGRIQEYILGEGIWRAQSSSL